MKSSLALKDERAEDSCIDANINLLRQKGLCVRKVWLPDLKCWTYLYYAGVVECRISREDLLAMGSPQIDAVLDFASKMAKETFSNSGES